MNDRMHGNDMLAMIKQRARAADPSKTMRCHTIRVTDITVYPLNGGTLEKA